MVSRTQSPIDSYQLALVVSAEQQHLMYDALLPFQGIVKDIVFYVKPGTQVLVLLNCGNSASAFVLRPKMAKVAEGLKASLVQLDSLRGSQRMEFQGNLSHFPLSTTPAGGIQAAFDALRRTTSGPPALRLQFSDDADFCVAWARHVAEGAMWIPSPRPPASDAFALEVVIRTEVIAMKSAKVLRDRPPRKGSTGFWLMIEAPAELLARVERFGREQRQGRKTPTPPQADRRQEVRYETALEVRFDNLPDFATEYATNISKGGLFIRCPKPPAMRTRISLNLRLPSGENVAIDAEVVHVLSPEQAAAMRTSPGVGVAFGALPVEKRERLEALLTKYNERTPKVLIAHADGAWAKKLGDAFGTKKIDVVYAANGRDAMLKLIDGFFELDLLVVQANLPDLDGKSLVDRIREQGGESGLHVVIVVDEPKQMAAMADKMTVVLPRTLPFDQQLYMLMQRLGLSVMGR